MDFVFEILFGIMVWGSVELFGNRKLPRVMRILCPVILISFYNLLIFMMMTMGIKMFGEDIKESIIIFTVAAFLSVAIITLFRKKCKNK